MHWNRVSNGVQSKRNAVNRDLAALFVCVWGGGGGSGGKEFFLLLSMKLEGFEQRDGTTLLYHNGLLLTTVFH